MAVFSFRTTGCCTLTCVFMASPEHLTWPQLVAAGVLPVPGVRTACHLTVNNTSQPAAAAATAARLTPELADTARPQREASFAGFEAQPAALATSQHAQRALITPHNTPPPHVSLVDELRALGVHLDDSLASLLAVSPPSSAAPGSPDSQSSQSSWSWARELQKLGITA